VQQKSHTSSDGRLGLDGTIIEPPKDKTEFLRDLTKGIAKLGKDTIRTQAGDYISATGRTLAIETGSQAIDHFLPQSDQPTVKRSSYILIPAGREFYLTISNSKNNRSNYQEDSKSSSLDILLEEAARSRLK